MPSPQEIHAAALDVIAQTLASDAGPDGRPSVRARRQAKKVMDALADGSLAEEMGDRVEEGRDPFADLGEGDDDDA